MSFVRNEINLKPNNEPSVLTFQIQICTRKRERERDLLHLYISTFISSHSQQ